MATGVLVVGLGHATRLLRFVSGLDKSYEATIRLGQGTVTDDAEGETTQQPGWEWDPAGLSAAISALTGDISQVPSAVSAIKVDGVRSYTRVRAGNDVELAARPISIRRFEMCGAPRPQPGRLVDVDVVVECSSGTYIRALARDLGAALGSAGHLTALRRTTLGPVAAAECGPPEAPTVVDVVPLLGRILPELPLADDAARLVRNGRGVQVDAPDGTYLAIADGAWVSVLRVAAGAAAVEVNAPG
jgi:tRNA pseudouridine55 synthase